MEPRNDESAKMSAVVTSFPDEPPLVVEVVSRRRRLPRLVVGIIVVWTCCATSPPGLVSAYRDGATRSACASLSPEHSYGPQDPSANPNPYILDTSDGVSEYRPGQVIRIRISVVDGTPLRDGFRGFMLQGRDAQGRSRGTFLVPETEYDPPGSARTLSCRSLKDTVTHRDPVVKAAIELDWQAPIDACDASSPITFRGTVAKNMMIYWVDWNLTLSPRVVERRCGEDRPEQQDDGSTQPPPTKKGDEL